MNKPKNQKKQYFIAGKPVTRKQFKASLQYMPIEHSKYLKQMNPELKGK